MQGRQRVAVVGVGILGACVGWNLAQQGAEVILVDAAQPGEGVTNWSFSWVNASNKTVSRPYFDLNVAGMVAHRRLAETIGGDLWWYPDGHLRWASDPGAQQRLLETVDLLIGWGYRVEVCTGAEVRGRFEPELAVGSDVPVAYYPDEAWVHGCQLVNRLLGHMVRSGVRCRFGTGVREIGTGAGGRVQSITLSDGASIDVDAVINAAGPAAAQVAALVGRALPMRHEPGVVARLACSRALVQRAMHGPHIEIRPDGDGSIVLHSREVDAQIGTAQEPHTLALQLLDAALEVVPALRGAQIAQSRIVNRPIPGDGFPSVGAVSVIPGYYEAVSHSGITLGPEIGQLLATEVLTEARDELLADFRPDRF